LTVGNTVGNKKSNQRKRDSAKTLNPFSLLLAGPTRLELATSGVTDIYKGVLFQLVTKTQRDRV
jgi:hypothetical protein